MRSLGRQPSTLRSKKSEKKLARAQRPAVREESARTCSLEVAVHVEDEVIRARRAVQDLDSAGSVRHEEENAVARSCFPGVEVQVRRPCREPVAGEERKMAGARRDNGD